MEKYFIQLIIVISLTASLSAQILGNGNCPKINVTENFSFPHFMGKWYEIRAYPFFYTLGSSCVSWTFIQNDNGTLNIETRQRKFGVEEIDIGLGVIGRSDMILISYPNSQIARADANYYIVATDYDNYAVIFSCTHALFVNAQNVWILSRRSILEDDYLKTAIAKMNEQELSSGFLGLTLQTCGMN